MSALNFYIIITPGSLTYLKFALWSLQQRKDLDVILVANGLNYKEKNSLKLFCNQIECSYIQLKTEKVLRHGDVLNILINQHTQPWFCFCDSDIISTNYNANDLPLLDNIKALSSCEAMFWDDIPVKGVLGRCNRWPDGSPNLSSFFCIYETQTLKYLINKYKFGFENIRPKNIQSNLIQSILIDKGINLESKRKLDTGKALTAALEIDGHKFMHKKISSLLHIGGLSSWILNGDRELVHAKYLLTDEDLYIIAKKGTWLYNPQVEIDPTNTLFYLRRQQRLSAARYCFQLISHYVDKTPMPIHTLSNEEFIKMIEIIENTLEQYFEEFS